MPVRAAIEVDRVHVRAAAVAHAEQHGTAVIGELGQRAGVAGAAGHHIAVERGGEVRDTLA